MLGRIYKITNNINGKVYIGQTIQTLQERWCGHCQKVLNKSLLTVIKRAIQKYGKENFTIALIEECDESLLDEREIYWIAYYNSYKEGYNSTLGGKQHSKMPKMIKEEKDILSLYLSGFSLRAIAKDYDVDHATIKRILTKANIPIRTTRSYKLTPELRKQIIEQVANRVSRKEIMKIYKISKSYLSQLINGLRRI